MNRVRAFFTVRVLVAAFIILFGAALYIASIPKSDAGGGLVCTYYSDATHQHVVGARGSGCCGAVINWGVITAFKKCQTLVCTQQVCPD